MSLYWWEEDDQLSEAGKDDERECDAVVAEFIWGVVACGEKLPCPQHSPVEEGELSNGSQSRS